MLLRQVGAAAQEVTVLGVAGEVDGGLAGRVAAADDHDALVAAGDALACGEPP